MNPFALSFLLTVISTWSMAAILFWKSDGRKAVIMWGWLCIAVSIWGIGGLMATTTLSREISLIGWEIANIGTITIPIVFFKFIDVYFELNQKTLLRFLYIAACIFLWIDFRAQHLFFGNIKFLFNQFYYIDCLTGKGPAYITLYIAFDLPQISGQLVKMEKSVFRNQMG